MAYRMQEGELAIPAEWLDKSMNVFVSAATGTEGVSFVISREPLPWGMKFEEYAANEISKLARTVPDYNSIETTPASVSDRPAQTHEFKWTNNGAPIHQQLTMVEYGHIVLMGNVPQTVEGWDGGCGIDYATLRSWSMLDFEGERFRAAASTQSSLTPRIFRKCFSASRNPAAAQRTAMSASR